MGEDAGGFVFFLGGKARRVEGYLVEKIHEMLCLIFFSVGGVEEMASEERDLHNI